MIAKVYAANKDYLADMMSPDLLSSLRADHEKAEELLKVSDPREMPYKSRYEARDILTSLVDRVAELVRNS